MITIYYLNDAKQEKKITYNSYDEFRQSQMSCLLDVADYFKVTKVLIDDKEFDYSGTFGDLFYTLDKELNK